MKKTIMGGLLFLGGCIVFSCCKLYVAFEGRSPHGVQGEKLISVFLMVIGAGLMVYSLLKERHDN